MSAIQGRYADREARKRLLDGIAEVAFNAVHDGDGVDPDKRVTWVAELAADSPRWNLIQDAYNVAEAAVDHGLVPQPTIRRARIERVALPAMAKEPQSVEAIISLLRAQGVRVVDDNQETG